jgi:hypothetical protein
VVTFGVVVLIFVMIAQTSERKFRRSEYRTCDQNEETMKILMKSSSRGNNNSVGISSKIRDVLVVIP